MRGHALLTLGILAALPVAAEANGRFPSSVSVHFRPGSTTDVYLGTTFGLVISHDDAASFYWICEQNVGYEGTFDPKYRVDDQGNIYATTFEGLRISRDGGCSFQNATGEIGDVWVDALDVGPDGAVWAATAETGRPNEIYRSTDRGVTFAPLGLASPEIWWKSVLVAPGQGMRAYVTGYQVTQAGPDGGVIPPGVHLYRTDDGGQNWTALPTTDFMLGTSPLLLVEAVAPGDGSMVFARSVRSGGPGDRLYRSLDAGATWTEVLATTDTIRDVVIRANGQVFVVTVVGGSFVSADQGATFGPLAAAPEAACLGDRGDMMFACGANWDPDFFSLGRSPDAVAWTKVFRFVELKGPLACPAGTLQRDTCEALLWPAIREQFGIADPNAGDGGPPSDPGGCCGTGGQGLRGVAVLGVLVLLGIRRRRTSSRAPHGQG